jgi:integrase
MEETAIDLSQFPKVIQEWAEEKYSRTHSRRTFKSYIETILAFRRYLQQQGLDLLSERKAIQPLLLTWLDSPQREDMREVTASTFNTRHAILSSFYRFAIKQDYYADGNPLDRVPRRENEPQPEKQPLDEHVLQHRLGQIDRSTHIGIRDYALIMLAAMTGKRDSELRSLDVGDLTIHHDGVMIAWRHMKGGKTEQTLLEHRYAHTLIAHLERNYGADWQQYGELPVFMPLAYHRGQRLSRSAITGILDKRLGTTRVHSLRKLFGRTMIKGGASVPYAQKKLGHANIATTQRYIESANSERNEFAADIGKLYGFTEEE